MGWHWQASRMLSLLHRAAIASQGTITAVDLVLDRLCGLLMALSHYRVVRPCKLPLYQHIWSYCLDISCLSLVSHNGDNTWAGTSYRPGFSGHNYVSQRIKSMGLLNARWTIDTTGDQHVLYSVSGSLLSFTSLLWGLPVMSSLIQFDFNPLEKSLGTLAHWVSSQIVIHSSTNTLCYKSL